jgi:hypothetical protein
LTRETRKTTEYTPDEPDRAGDQAWLESDLSKLGKSEPYEWEEGELEEGRPVNYEPGVGAVVEGGKRRG